MRRALVVIFALALVGRAEGLLAGVRGGPSDEPRSVITRGALPDLLPSGLTTYASSRGARDAAPAAPVEATPAGGLAYAGGRSSYLARADGDDNASSGKRCVPVLLSLVVPGAGEIYMGYYVRGAVLVAAEITAWTGYAYYHNKGLDSRAEYEKFADDHWDYGKWVDDHALWRDPDYTDVDPKDFAALDSIGRNYWDGWPPYHTWHSKEEEKQNYYENIGKYDWFISGWEDWDAVTQPRESALRTTYRSMRKQSNDELDKATGFIYLSVAARVFSLVETLLLTRYEDSDSGKEDSSSSFSIKTRATGLASGEVALVYRFR